MHFATCAQSTLATDRIFGGICVRSVARCGLRCVQAAQRSCFNSGESLGVVNCSCRIHQNEPGVGLTCNAMLQHTMAHRRLRDGEVQLCECSSHIRVTRTRDCPLQSCNLRFASAMHAGVSIISLT